MKRVVNLEETPGKVVGDSGRAVPNYDRLVETGQSVMPRLPFPKGVYRFRTHEEADAWTERHILKAALKQAHARPKEKPKKPEGLRQWLKRVFGAGE
ncbi:MAG: hypothetical protein HY735_29065 [Verrucomicrobia bacterium]|nr:hypothetical protein [Verrucomicrobiota bacterium]